MLITQVHIEQGCASETQQQLLQRPKYIPKFPKEMTLRATSPRRLLWPASLVSPRSAEQPLQPAGTHTYCVEEASTRQPVWVLPLARSSPRYPYTPLKPRAVAATPAARCHLGTGHSVWGNTKIAVHTLLLGHLHNRSLKYYPWAPFFSNFILYSYYSHFTNSACDVVHKVRKQCT